MWVTDQMLKLTYVQNIFTCTDSNDSSGMIVIRDMLNIQSLCKKSTVELITVFNS